MVISGIVHAYHRYPRVSVVRDLSSDLLHACWLLLVLFVAFVLVALESACGLFE